MPKEDTQFKSGEDWKGNKEGRPKGTSLKEFWKKKLADMTEEEKALWTKEVSKDLVWRMAEGNPHNTEDITSAGKPVPLLNVLYNDSSKENITPEEKA